jgi:AcrR family transcriptional regulator
MNTAARSQASKRDARGHRILDAAGELILRWGYNKTTIDDIAQQAGVAKGTIYLHWRSREELFGALMLRERLALSDDLHAQLAADPAGATLRGLVRHSALGLMQRPLLKAVLLHDTEIIGKLAHNPDYHSLYEERIAGFKTYLEILRAHGQVRTDIDLDAQVYTVGAIFAGFFLVGPLLPDALHISDAQLADLLAETVHRTLELQPADQTPTPAIADSFGSYIERATANVQNRLEQSLRPRASSEERPDD